MIEDFGEKIGGAKKDLWKKRNLNINDTLDMNQLEKDKYITKNNVWKKPNYEELVDSGISKRIVYFQSIVRNSLPPKPVLKYNESLQDAQERYIEVIEEIRDLTMNLTNEQEVLSFYKDKIYEKLIFPNIGRYVTIREDAEGIITNKFLKAIQMNSFSSIDSNIKRKHFCYTAEEITLLNCDFIEYEPSKFEFEENEQGKTTRIQYKNDGRLHFYYPRANFNMKDSYIPGKIIVVKNSMIVNYNHDSIESAKEEIIAEYKKLHNIKSKSTTGKKKSYTPPQLLHINRDGQNYRSGKNVNGNDYLEVFNFRGGEFGNWVNDKERQASLDYGFDALLDLCYALEISPASISLGNNLALAFGARGSGGALAHFEPMSNVINLTKMKGAGSLAHEWGHALDYALGKKEGLISFATSATFPPKETPFAELIHSLKFDENRELTKFYKDARYFDANYSKSTNGYWASDVELFARAFACYVSDKLNHNSDYLCGHANVGSDGEHLTYPVNEEREEFNQKFDILIDYIKEINLVKALNPLEVDQILERFKPREIIEDYDDIDYSSASQMSLFDDVVDEPIVDNHLEEELEEEMEI